MDDMALRFYLEDFRKQINSARNRLGITTEQICDALDVTRQSLSNFENERGNFKLVNALAISTLFDFVMIDKNITIREIGDFAIAKLDYSDYLYDNSLKIDSLCYAWQRKIDIYSNIKSKSVFVEDEIEEYILFVDVFSFMSDEFYERFLWWMLRVINNKKKLNVFVDSSIKNPNIIKKEKNITAMLNALVDVKKSGFINLQTMKTKNGDFGQDVKRIIEEKNFIYNKCAIVSSDINKLKEFLMINIFVLGVDGILFNLSGEYKVLDALTESERQKEKNSVDTVPLSLLDELFD